MKTKPKETEPKSELQMHAEPMIRAAKKVYRQSNTFQIDELLKRRSKWQRRLTIATGKLAEVDFEIRELAIKQALRLDGAPVEPESK